MRDLFRSVYSVFIPFSLPPSYLCVSSLFRIKYIIDIFFILYLLLPWSCLCWFLYIHIHNVFGYEYIRLSFHCSPKAHFFILFTLLLFFLGVHESLGGWTELDCWMSHGQDIHLVIMLWLLSQTITCHYSAFTPYSTDGFNFIIQVNPLSGNRNGVLSSLSVYLELWMAGLVNFSDYAIIQSWQIYVNWMNISTNTIFIRLST